MKPFRFTLQAVRTLRERQEREALEHYGQTLIERLRAVERLETAEHELAQARFEWQQLASAGAVAADLTRLQAGCATLAARRDECAGAVATAERMMNRALHTFRTARQACETVDNLFENQRAAHARAVNQAEQKNLDDLVRRPFAPALVWKAAAY